MPINIFVADDKVIYREGLKLLLEKECDVCVCGQSNFDVTVFPSIRELNPNIVIVDCSSNPKKGIEFFSKLKTTILSVKTIIISDNDNFDEITYAFEKGCDGFVLTNNDISVLKRAVYSVYKGDKYAHPDIMEKIKATINIQQSVNEKISNLTRREIEVLKLIAEGLFNKEIAIDLNISERTVKNHIANIFKKIDVNDRTQAAVFAIKNNLYTI